MADDSLLIALRSEGTHHEGAAKQQAFRRGRVSTVFWYIVEVQVMDLLLLTKTMILYKFRVTKSQEKWGHAM